MAQKTQVRTTVQKNGLSSKFSSMPITLRFIIVLLVIAGIGAAGTLGYTKYKERELKAQAGAFVVARRGAASNTSFAVCKTQDGYRTRVRGIVARKPSETVSTASMTVFQPGSGGKPGAVYQRSESSAWYWGAITAMELHVPANGWVSLSYNSSYTDKIAMGFVPFC